MSWLCVDIFERPSLSIKSPDDRVVHIPRNPYPMLLWLDLWLGTRTGISIGTGSRKIAGPDVPLYHAYFEQQFFTYGLCTSNYEHLQEHSVSHACFCDHFQGDPRTVVIRYVRPDRLVRSRL